MNTKKLIAVAAVAAIAVLPSWAAEYVADAANPPTSLADGKIAFEYDGAGKITELRMTPDAGETLALSGDTLDFAANARLMPGQNGISCISNAIACAGTLQIGMTNMTYNGSLLSRDEYTTMFTNVRLADISPISSDMNGVSATGGKIYYPYHVTRDGDTLRAEFQAVHSPYVKCVYLELKQDGDNIVGKILNSGYYEQVAYLGVSLFEDPMFTPTSYNYGMKQLTIGPRREEYVHSRDLISQNGTVVAANAQLEDLEIAYAFSGIPKKYSGCPRMTSYPSHVKVENGVLSAQFQMVDSTSLKCVKLAFSQVGTNVVASYVYAKYFKNFDEEHDYDFDNEGVPYDIMTKELYDANSNAYGYGIDMVVLRNKARNRLLLPTPGWRNIDMPLAGGGCEVIFDSGTNSGGATESSVTRSANLWCGTNDFVKLTTGVSLKDFAIVGGRVAGGSCGKAAGRDSLVVGWRNNGTTATCQVHALHDAMVKCVDVELRQNGDDVEIRCTRAVVHTTKGSTYFGRKVVVPGVDGAVEMKLTTSADQGDYGLLWVEWDVRPQASVFATAANTMINTTFTIKGDATRPLDFRVLNANALPAGSTECWGDSSLYISIDGSFGSGISGGNSDIIMNPGTRLYQGGAQAFVHSRQKITLDAATLYGQYLVSNQCYANFLTLANGAYVCGSGPLQLGYDTTAKWTIAGEGVVTNEMDIMVFSYNQGANARYPGIDVADTVEGDAADFIQNGDIYNNSQYFNAAITKTGPGTMLMNGTFSTTNAATRIVEGTIVLNKSGAALAEVGFDLMGGTLALAAETANEIANVAVTADSALSVGAGATLTLANLTVAEGKMLTVEYAGDIDNKGVKVSAALDSATLSRIRLNGKRARQSSDGYLCRGGFMVIVW